MPQQTAQDLLDLKDQIAQAKTAKAEAEGALKQVKKELAEDHGCKTFQAAEAKLERMDAQIEKLNAQIAEGKAQLKEDYDV